MNSEYTAIKWEREGPIGIITLNRPDDLNALKPELQAELIDLVGRLPGETDLQVIILTGSGKAFSAGGDLDSFMKRSIDHQEQGGAMPLFKNRLPRTFLNVEIPIIAAVNGAAVGGGFTILLTCDLRIASEEARFGALFAKVGLSPEYGSSYLLSRVVGLTKASELILTAKIFDAEEALGMGLITEMVPADQLMTRARELATQIADLPPFAVRMCKRTIRHGLECTLSQALDYEELAITHGFISKDHQEAVRAFMEKRSPKFQGR